jgi:uncharacterized protein YndB with AHSA1/START domain
MSEQPQTPNDRLVRTRTIPASVDQIFTLLSDPRRHHETEPGDWVRGAIDGTPITEVGQVFSMNMYLDVVGGAYRVDNTVTTFDPPHAIAWDPGQADESGRIVPGGWRWRYDLTASDAGTEVTLTYDWSATTEATREEFGGFPPFPAEFLDASLESLERAVTG